LLQKLHNNLFVWLKLQEFEHQAEKRSWFDVAGVDATDIAQFNASVNDQLG
jgi:hypothetical protein